MSAPARRRRALAFALAGLGLLGAVSLAALALGSGAPRPPHPWLASLKAPLVFAHRGGGGEAPEGTLAAILGAHRRDPTVGIELDVRSSRDGHLLVMHDATVDRTTDGTGRVADLTLAELQALDAGYCATPGVRNGTARRDECRTAPAGQFPFRGKGHRIPTLDQVFAALPADALLSLEVKAAGFENRFAAQVRASGRLGRLLVGSADDDIAEELKRLLPEAAHYLPRRAAACLAVATKLGVGAGACASYDVLAGPRTAMGLDLTTPGMIAATRARGVPLLYFTVNDEAEMERLFRQGAAGIFTDYPGRARRVLDRLGGRTPWTAPTAPSSTSPTSSTAP